MAYLPGLDGLRAFAVAAVMIYHADPRWLPGGFLGVEVFFVISGFLITRLLVAEQQREQRIDLQAFWYRRFRRLLPALLLMLALLVVAQATLYPEAQGRTRGDILAGLLYVSNWDQLWEGAGYTASEAFVPLRHLWSLAVEEQFYLVWPLVMVVVLRRRGARLGGSALGLLGVAFAIHMVIALLYVPGDIDSVCTPDTMTGYWQVLGRCVRINDFLYLSTVTRLGGLMLGAALGLVWIPEAVHEGPWRTEGRQLDLLALIGASTIGLLMWSVHLAEPASTILTGSRFDPWLFRGGLLLTGIATLFVILGISHPGALTARVLGGSVLRWIGVRSYGLYLFHWPIYQLIRRQAGRPMALGQLAAALLMTLVITELSYRFVEVPVRHGALGLWWRKTRASGRWIMLAKPWPQTAGLAIAGVVLLAASVNLVIAPVRCLGEVDCATQAGRAAIAAAANGRGTRPVTVAPSPPTPDDQLRSSALIPIDGPIGPFREMIQWADSVVSVAPPVSADTGPPMGVAVPADSVPDIDSVPAPPLDSSAQERPRPAVFAIGESVMLGAAAQLQAAGFVVDAEVSRQGGAAARRLREIKAQGRLGEIVVLQVGTNGPVDMEVYEEIMTVLPAAQHPRVIFLTVFADRPWIDGNNARLWLLARRYPNVEILDWYGHVTAGEVRGMAEDGIHLGTLGARRFYTGMILRHLAQSP